MADDSASLNDASRAIWDTNARFWDDYFGEGNRYQNELIGPATERLLAIQPGENVLDVACGNGAFARRMAALGANVVAFDFSARMIEHAQKRSSAGEAIEYHVIDATDEDALLTLGERRFDAAVCTMALMDMARIEPLLSALARLLKPGGRFVFSVVHPFFNSSEGTSVVAERPFEKRGEVVRAIKLSKYITPSVWQGEAIAGQPELQYYFHRPLSVLFGACFGAGFALDGLEEPVFTEEVEGKDALSWANLKEIPPLLIARMRLRR